MTAQFRADRRQRPTATFDAVEAELLRGLVAQLVELVESDGAVRGAAVPEWAAELGLADVGTDGSAVPPADPVLARLLPDAYGEDPHAASEFRRITEPGLRRTKSDRARAVLQALGDPGAGVGASGVEPGDPAAADPVTVRLEPGPAQGWLTVLTDLRLALAVRLGIRTEADSEALDAGLARPARRGRRRTGTRVPPDAGDPAAEQRAGVYAVYSWLGYLQESLVASLG